MPVKYGLRQFFEEERPFVFFIFCIANHFAKVILGGNQIQKGTVWHFVHSS
jgi:hypothetical protein